MKPGGSLIGAVWDLQLLVKVGRGFTSPVSNPKRFVKVGRWLGELGSVTLSRQLSVMAQRDLFKYHRSQ